MSQVGRITNSRPSTHFRIRPMQRLRMPTEAREHAQHLFKTTPNWKAAPPLGGNALCHSPASVNYTDTENQPAQGSLPDTKCTPRDSIYGLSNPAELVCGDRGQNGGCLWEAGCQPEQAGRFKS